MYLIPAVPDVRSRSARSSERMQRRRWARVEHAEGSRSARSSARSSARVQRRQRARLKHAEGSRAARAAARACNDGGGGA
eukprot:5140119-Pleurochrysis_carterae.AAC.1